MGRTAAGWAARPAPHHQLSNVLRRHEADQAALRVGDADRRSAALFQRAQGILKALAVTHEGDPGLHDFEYGRVRAALAQGADHAVAREHAAQPPAAVHNRELVLRRADQALHRMLDPARRRQALELGDHRIRSQHAARDLPHLHVVPLRGSAEIDEERDEQQDRVPAEQPEQPEQHGKTLPDHGGNPCRAGVAEPVGEQRPQCPAAVHGKGGEQVEQRQKQVGREQARNQVDV